MSGAGFLLPGSPRSTGSILSDRRAAPRDREATFVDVTHGGTTFRVRIKRIATARRLTLRVRAATGDTVLTMPARGSIHRARLFAERHAAWIAVRMARLPVQTPFGPGAAVPLRGVAHAIVHRPGARCPAAIETLGGAPALCIGGDVAFVERRVRDFLVGQARNDLRGAVTRHTATLGVTARRITLRDTTSRWGSCSSTGSLNFSWRLVMAPPFVLDYLAAHEVAHLVHMNHSQAFWSVVGRLIPDYRRAEAWLKSDGGALMRYGAGQRGGPEANLKA